ncbi:MAG: hypothetical protein M9921_00400 [Fimbriimonadaceae bacterium]|nr:hypothetical protein [Fimbriimonadaceae bacterium]
MNILKATTMLAALLCALAVQAQTLTVTSPTDGAFVGSSTQVKFLISGATLEVTVKALATGPGGVQTSVEGRFTPNSQGQIDNNLTLSFGPSNPEGAYTIVVTATEPGATYTPKTLNVTLDRTKPKFLQFNPTNNAFVRGPFIPISVELDEANVKEWRVQVNNQDIPNNTGNTQSFTVTWDTSGIELDGAQTITIKVTDEAENTATQSISVTLDRVDPVLTIQYPRSDTNLRRRATISVVVDVTDLSTSSIDVTGIDVFVQSLTGAFITRVARSSVRTSGNNTLRWSGRIRWRPGLPNEFKIVTTARDRAGNVAATQEVTVRLR